jgi:hypothetical protein
MNHRKQFPWRAACALMIGLVVLSAPSRAYRMSHVTGTGPTVSGVPVQCTDPQGFAHWITTNITWYHNTSGQGSGKAAALFNGMNVWTFVDNADYFLTYAGTTTAGFDANDLRNTAVWTTSSLCSLSNNCIALTMLNTTSDQVIQEADIMFNANAGWTTNGGVYDTWATAAHEFGHTLGIHHTEIGPGPTMHIDYNLGWRDLEPDDRSALQCAYVSYQFQTTKTCVPNGGVDDSSSSTSCCSGLAVTGSTYCPAGSGCYQICATPLVNGCVPSGGVDDTLSSTRCCSGAAVSGSTRCLNPADYNNGWKTCIQTCL